MAKSLSKDQAEFLKGRFQKWESAQSDAVELRSKLLVIGGLEIVAPPNNFEPDITLLLQAGAEQTGERRLIRMEDNSCHQNAAQLYLQANRPGFGIGTGYALDGGLWRQHSWAVDAEVIVETTVEAERYFGIVLYGDDAKRFCEMVNLN